MCFSILDPGFEIIESDLSNIKDMKAGNEQSKNVVKNIIECFWDISNTIGTNETYIKMMYDRQREQEKQKKLKALDKLDREDRLIMMELLDNKIVTWDTLYGQTRTSNDQDNIEEVESNEDDIGENDTRYRGMDADSDYDSDDYT